MQPGLAVGHSSLSPKNPLSPLYSDGLMTPTWVQRHREIIPSVFVAFYELSDLLQEGSWNGYQRQSGGVQGPLDAGKDPNVGYRERERDQLLVMEINETKYVEGPGSSSRVCDGLISPNPLSREINDALA
jgi:trafficking protein particle complex subunit 11